MKKLDKMLWEGVEENDLRKVALALNLGADVNTKDIGGISPLIWAVNKGNTDLVKLLIKAGADVDTEDCFGLSPSFIWAIKTNQEIKALLKKREAEK